jgi:hypothetical protein
VGPTALSAGTLEEGLVLTQLSVAVQVVSGGLGHIGPSGRLHNARVRGFARRRAIGVDAGRAGTLRRRITEAGGAGEKMTRTELIIQLLKVAIGLAFGVYFVWWSLEVLDRLAPENEAPTPAVQNIMGGGLAVLGRASPNLPQFAQSTHCQDGAWPPPAPQ